MVDMATEVVNNAIEGARKRLSRGEDDLVQQTFKNLAKNPATRTYFTSEEDHLPSHNGTRPSAYLRSRCPLCFGGDTYEGIPGQ